jgi:hypothetical protein
MEKTWFQQTANQVSDSKLVSCIRSKPENSFSKTVSGKVQARQPFMVLNIEFNPYYVCIYDYLE